MANLREEAWKVDRFFWSDQKVSLQQRSDDCLLGGGLRIQNPRNKFECWGELDKRHLKAA